MGDITDLHDYLERASEDFECADELPEVYFEMAAAADQQRITEIDLELLVRFEHWASHYSGDPFVLLYLTDVRNELQRRLTVPPSVVNLSFPV